MGITGHPVDEPTKKILEPIVHFVFEMATGGAYPVLVREFTLVRAGYGALFGICFWLGAHEIGLPSMNLSPTPAQMTLWEQGNEFVAHIFFGFALEFARRFLAVFFLGKKRIGKRRPSSSRCVFTLRKLGTTATAKASWPTPVTSWEGTRRAMAARCFVCASRILKPSSTRAASRRSGRKKHRDFATYYTQAEELYDVHGERGIDPAEPPIESDYPFPALPREPRIQELFDRLTKRGHAPFKLPLAANALRVGDHLLERLR